MTHAGLVLGAMLLNFSQVELAPPDLRDDTLSFELPDLEGNLVSSSDKRFEDKVVLVDLWGTWCPPCRVAIPFLVELQKRYGEDGLIVVGIAFESGDTAEDRRAKIREFAQDVNINYLLLDGGGDPDSALTKALPDVKATRAFPTMFVIGRDGTVQYSKSGFHPDDKQSIENELKKIIED